MIKHYLEFVTSGHGTKEIWEPVGFREAEFVIEQEDDRIGRDVSYAAGSNKLKFYKNSEHCFDLLRYNMDKFGYEAVVKYIVVLDDVQNIIGQLDFSTLATDMVDYIEFSVGEENIRTILKKREEIKVDLFSDKTLDGEPIAAVQKEKMLIKAKPTIEKGRWNAPLAVEKIGAISQKTPSGVSSPIIVTTNTGVNPSYNLYEQTSGDFLGYISTQTALTGGIPNVETFTYFEALENFENLTIKISNVDLRVQSVKSDSITPSIISASGYSMLVIFRGFDLESATPDIVHQKNFINETSSEYTFPESYTDRVFTNVKRGERIWIYLVNNVSVEFTDTNVLSSYSIFNRFTQMEVAIEGKKISYSTVVWAVRLIDAIKYVVKSTCGLDVVAPRWEFGGEFYDQYITSTPLMRNLPDKPFYWSFKEVTDDYFPEVFADFQVQKDNKVFIGIYEDFYRNVEIGNFLTSLTDSNGRFTGQISGFKLEYNQRYKINQFSYKYENYASKKENEQDNTYDLVHGENQRMLNLRQVENKKEISVGVIRDAFYIEQTRRKAYNIADTAATQDDDKIYIIDVVPYEREGYYSFIETSTLQHSAPSTGVLILTNDQSFSWLQLGIVPGDSFFIASPSANATIFTITGVTDTQLNLFLAGYDTQNVAEENTTYAYRVSGDVLITNRTNEGFTQISNIADGQNYANLRFTVARNEINYYNQYLATCNLFANGEPIENTLYYNNPDAITRYGDETQSIIEGAPIIPSNPILSTVQHKAFLIMTLQDYIDLENNIRSQRGFIRYFDADGLPIKGYIRKGPWNFLSNGTYSPDDFIGVMEAEIEVKLQPFYMEIISDGNGLITINGEVTPNTFTFSIDELGKLSIFDETGKLLHIPIYYDRVKVNNSGSAPNGQTLMVWLQALKNEN